MGSLIRATSLQAIDTLIEELGGNARDIFTHWGISVDVNQLDTHFLTYRSYAQLLEYCAHELSCSDFGIRLANRQGFDVLGPIALVAKTGATLNEVLSQVIKYLHIHSPALSLKMNHRAKDEVFISFEILLQPLPSVIQVTELTIALMVKTIRQLSANKCRLKRVYLPQKLTHNRVYASHFLCEVIGYRNIAGVVISRRDLDISLEDKQLSPIKSALKFLEQQGAITLHLTDQVKTLIKPLLAIEQCTNEHISQALGLQTRQLHRLLALKNTSFIKLKNEVRKELAQHYLCESNLALGYISQLLGYREQATFSNACRGWFNCSARHLRQASHIN